MSVGIVERAYNNTKRNKLAKACFLNTLSGEKREKGNHWTLLISREMPTKREYDIVFHPLFLQVSQYDVSSPDLCFNLVMLVFV